MRSWSAILISLTALLGILAVAFLMFFQQPGAAKDVAANDQELESERQEKVSAPVSPGFFTGGDPLPVEGSGGEADAPIALSGPTSPTVFFAVNHENPALRPLPIHRRTRVFSFDDPHALRPPAPGKEAEDDRRVIFDLFPDVRLIGQIERLERHSDERAVYFGGLEGIAGGDFILGYNRGAVVATFTTPGLGSYQIRYAGDGYHAAIELDPAAFPPCEAGEAAGDFYQPASQSKPGDIRLKAALHQALAESASGPVDGGAYGGVGQQGGDGSGMTFTEIDVMIVHTTAATAEAGGNIGIEAVIDVSVARANSAFINSDIALRLRLVRTEEVAYSESGHSTDLSHLSAGVGAFSSVPTWRNQSGADLVALFVSGSGGMAYVFNGSATAGFSVTGQAGGEGTFVHEIGHNLGCLHDRENNSLTPLYPYAHGWRFSPEDAPEFRTVMAYAPGARLPYFSNPEITYMGVMTGVPIGEVNESHNAQVIRNTMATVANFRNPAGNLPPIVTIDSPSYGDSFSAMDSLNLVASANDPDGSVTEVRFYRLKQDQAMNFVSVYSMTLGSDVNPPYEITDETTPAGFWTYAAVAIDNDGGVGIDTLSLTVAPHYRPQNLPLPGGKLRVAIEGINEAGRIVGFGHNGNPAASDTQAAYWENGSVTLLNPLPGDSGAKALAVGNDGVIYGESIGGGGRRAVWWNQSITPVDISGVISGYTAEAALGVDRLQRVYLVSGGDYRRFDDPGATSTGLNERFTKVTNTGEFATGHDYNFGLSAFVGIRWKDTGTQLTPLDGSVSSWGRAVNRHGSVFGFSAPLATQMSSATNRLTFWPAGEAEPIDLGTLGEAGGWAYDLNDFDHAVGSANHPAEGGLAVIWKGGGNLLDLNQLILPRSGLMREARAINNRGQVVVTGFEGATQVLYLFDPLPGLSHDYWLSAHFSVEEIEEGVITGDLADPDGDGIPNLLERALGLDPRVPYGESASGGSLPEVTLEEDGHLYFVIRRLRSPRDIHYIPEASLTLGPGSWDDGLLEKVEVNVIDDDFEEVVLRTTMPVSEEERAFARLRVAR